MEFWLQICGDRRKKGFQSAIPIQKHLNLEFKNTDLGNGHGHVISLTEDLILNPNSCVKCTKNSPFETEDLFDRRVILQKIMEL